MFIWKVLFLKKKKEELETQNRPMSIKDILTAIKNFPSQNNGDLTVSSTKLSRDIPILYKFSGE